ncbi:MAG: MFS transporter [Alphaproteobacteria bacterium]|nr:MFS transporter [Alphaproteobacteria bacterium]
MKNKKHSSVMHSFKPPIMDESAKAEASNPRAGEIFDAETLNQYARLDAKPFRLARQLHWLNELFLMARAKRRAVRQRELVARLSRSLLLVLILMQVLLIIVVHSFFDDLLEREIYGQAFQFAEQTQAAINYALGLGAGLPDLYALDQSLIRVINSTEAIEALAIHDANGELLEAVTLSGASETPPHPAEYVLQLGTATNDGTISVWVNRGLISEFLLNARYEVGFMLLVFFLVCQELVSAMVSVYVTTPLYVVERLLRRLRRADFSSVAKRFPTIEMNHIVRDLNHRVRRINQMFVDYQYDVEGRAHELSPDDKAKTEKSLKRIAGSYRFVPPSQERVLSSVSPGAVRTPCFLFFFANELPTGFLPLYLNQLDTTLFTDLPESYLISLPFIGFFIALSIGVSLSGAVVERLSEKHTFVLGMLPAMVGYAWLGAAPSLEHAILARSVTGFGYGLIFIAGQNYIIRHADNPSRRTRDVSVFSRVVMTAIFAGPVLGSLLAERIGYDFVFAMAAVFSLFSGLTALLLFSNEHETPHDEPSSKQGFFTIWKGLIAHRQFFALSVLVAIPAKLALTGIIFYLVPLVMNEFGESTSFTGRTIMVYGLVYLVLTPLLSRYTDERWSPQSFLVIGIFLSGFSLLVPALGADPWYVLVALALLGLSHSMVLSQQLVVLREQVVVGIEGLSHARVVSRFRQVERAGTIVGFIAIPFLSNVLGYRWTIVVIGVIILLCSALFLVLMHRDIFPNVPWLAKRKPPLAVEATIE